MEKILYNAMFSKIQKELTNNKNKIDELQNIDLKYSKIKIDVNKLIEIIEYYKTKEIKENNQEIFIFCNGNPYIVLNVTMLTIINNMSTKINIRDTMVGVNKYILEVINKILEKNNLKIKIELAEKPENENKIIFIDRINDFNIMKKKNKKIIPYQSIDVYCEEEKFEKLFEEIYNYAINMNIDIDIFVDEEIESMIKYGKGKIKLILTEKKEIINKYKNENIYINENPFKKENIIFEDEIINKIIM